MPIFMLLRINLQCHKTKRAPTDNLSFILIYGHSLVAQMIKNLPAMWETWVQPLGQEDLLEKKMATHSSSCLENPMGRGVC